MSPVLRGTGLSRSYRTAGPFDRFRPFDKLRERNEVRLRERIGVHEVDISVRVGERVGLVGASGSGKSTLLRLLLALDRPDAGSVEFDGRTVRMASTSALRWYRRRVQYVPQDPASSLDPRRSVHDLVREPLRRLGVQPEGGEQAAIRTALDRVGLPSGLDRRRAGELSGGQAQRVAIARAIATGPELLLADEPVSGLDLPLRNQVVDVLRDLSVQGDLGLLLVTHDLSVVAALCERTVVMWAGEVVEDRPTEEILSAPAHERTAALIDAVPALPR